MKKQIFAAAMALCLMAGTSVFAQKQNRAPMPKERPTVEQMAQRMTERMTDQLNLTDAQAKQVYEINLGQIKQMQAQREQMRAARTAEAEKMKSILTTEQFVKWSQMQGPRPGEHHGKMAGRNGKHCKDGKPCRKGNDCNGKPCRKADRQ